MNKKIKKYKVGMNSDVLAVSFVTEPAIEEHFVALKKDSEDVICLSTNEKHMAYGAVLVPDKEIYRNDKSGEYTLTFSKDSIEKMSQNYMKFKREDMVTLQHDEVADNVVLVESWIKCDMEKDKSVALGLNPDLPCGTWFAGYKVNDVDVWGRIKNGELRGFSVESIIEANELDFSADEAPTAEPEVAPEPAPAPEVSKEKGILDKIMDLLTGKSMEEVTTAKPDHSKNGINENVAVEEETKVAVEEQPKEEVIEVKPDPKAEIPADNNDVAPEVNPLQEVVDNLKAEIDALKKANEGLLNKIGEISREPSAKPVNTNAGNAGAANSYSNWRDQMQKMLG